MTTNTKQTAKQLKAMIGKTYKHSRLGNVKVIDIDEKHGAPIAILSCGEWAWISDLW